MVGGRIPSTMVRGRDLGTWPLGAGCQEHPAKKIAARGYIWPASVSIVGKPSLPTLPDMYGTLEIPMPLDEYHCLPRKLGWTYDYDGGRAIVTPAEILVDVSRPVAMPTAVGSIGRLRLCSVDDNAFALEELYFDAFRPSAETAGLRDADVRSEATFAMILYASGALGAPTPYSRALIDGNDPIAALLVAQTSAGPRMQLVIVHPHHQRRGLATILLGEVCAALALAGFEEIHSRYLLANEPARRWYRKMQFTERPNARAVEHHRRFYHYERARLEGSASAEVHVVERELQRWEKLAAGP